MPRARNGDVEIEYQSFGDGLSQTVLLVNGLGATAHLEQYILYRAARRHLESNGARVVRSYVGEFITSLEMAGASVTVTLVDAELLSLLDDEARAPRFRV